MPTIDSSQSILHRTRLCTFFARGRCNRGDMCTFAHGPVDLQPKPDLTQTKLCPLRGRCTNKRCTFAHSWYELRYVKDKRPRKWSVYYAKDVHKVHGCEPVRQVETAALETIGPITSSLQQADVVREYGGGLTHTTVYWWYVFVFVGSH